MVSGTESSYFFEDNTVESGQFYQYRVVAQNDFLDEETNKTVYEDVSAGSAYGFC